MMQASNSARTAAASTAAPPVAAPDALPHALLSAMLQLRRLPLADTVDRGSLQVLSELALRGPSRPSAVAAALRLDLSTISRHIRSLEDGGLVERSPDPCDARAQSVRVERAGLAVLEHAFRTRAELINGAVAAWAPSDRQQLTQLLTRLASDLGAEPHCPDPSHRKEQM